MKANAMDLETAQKVVLAAREAEEAKRTAQRQEYVGKFYRYRNSYGSGEKWWLYGMVTKAEPYVGCRGMAFQRPSDDRIEIDLDARIGVDGGGWQEITATAFWSEAASLRDVISSILTRDTAKGTAATEKPRKANRVSRSKSNSRGGT